MNKDIAHPGGISSIFAVFILHFDNLEDVGKFLHVTTELRLATTRKIIMSVFKEHKTGLGRTEEEQTKAICGSLLSAHPLNLGKKQKITEFPELLILTD